MDWDRDVLDELESMSIFARERLRERLAEYVHAEGRTRVTAADVAHVREAGGMRGKTSGQQPLEPHDWPVFAGRYRLLDASAPVAVCTLASEALADALGSPAGVSIAGPAFTENLGVEKVATNVVSNAAIRVLLLCGTESRHHVGQTLIALHDHGLDPDGRVAGSRGPLPVLRNFPPEAQALFRAKTRIIDLVGVTDVETILGAIAGVMRDAPPWPDAWRPPQPVQRAGPQPARLRDDPAGFLLLSVGPRGDRLVAEHYTRDAAWLASYEAPTAESLCSLLAESGAVTELTHAAYVGREAMKAELAMKHGLTYVQDRALELG